MYNDNNNQPSTMSQTMTHKQKCQTKMTPILTYTMMLNGARFLDVIAYQYVCVILSDTICVSH